MVVGKLVRCRQYVGELSIQQSQYSVKPIRGLPAERLYRGGSKYSELARSLRVAKHHVRNADYKTFRELDYINITGTVGAASGWRFTDFAQ